MAAIALALLLAGSAAQSADKITIDCSASESAALGQNSTCNRVCRSQLYTAVSGLYNVYRVDESHAGRAQLNLPWSPSTACATCCIDGMTRLSGEQAAFSPDPSCAPGSLRVPSYCCWPGVVCCSEAIRLQVTAAVRCEPYVIYAIVFDYFNATGAFEAGMPYLRVSGRD